MLTNTARIGGVRKGGGTKDLAACAKRVFIAMEHNQRRGAPRVLKQCNLPITSPGVVKLLATDLGPFEITEDGFALREHSPGWSPEEIQDLTEAELIIADDLREMRVRPA